MTQNEDANTPKLSVAKKLALNKALRASKLANSERGSPRERGFERTKEAIEWTYKWGWTTPTILEINAGTTKSGLANRLVKSGLLNRIEAPSGGINSTPTFLLTLTQKGLEIALEITDELLPYETDPHKINLKNVSHDELVQRLTAKYLWFTPESGGIDDYKTPKQLHSWNADSVKIPDAIWVKGDSGFALEVELSGKWNVEFDRFITMTVSNLLLRKDAPEPTFAGVLFFTKSPALLERYQTAFQAGKKYPLWKKEQGKTGRWKQKTNSSGEPLIYQITSQISKLVKFQLIENKMIEASKVQEELPVMSQIRTIEGL